jgi:hypothetical protein
MYSSSETDLGFAAWECLALSIRVTVITTTPIGRLWKTSGEFRHAVSVLTLCRLLRRHI